MSTAMFIAAALLFMLRLLLTVLAFYRCNLGGFILGVISAVALVTTVTAWRCGQADLTPRGLSVGLLHLLPLCIVPGPASLLWSAIFWVLVVVQTVAKLNLGRRCTVTGPVFVDLVEAGLYRVVRHPMTAMELLIALAIIGANPILWNFAMIPVVVLSKLILIYNEELFLRGFGAYQLYCERVRYRLCPGVW